jgi:hypothetical protein
MPAVEVDRSTDAAVQMRKEMRMRYFLHEESLEGRYYPS